MTLDDNSAAQSHAEDMRANCFLSHYGSDGSKTYMRYTSAGGQQNATSVINGISYCPEDAHRYRRDPINNEIDQAMASLLDGGGTTRNILDPQHRKVNIGISYEHPNLWLVLLFVGDYIDYASGPSIQDGVLRLAGDAKNGARLDTGEFDVVVVYDHLPSPLTRGQIHNAGCFDDGLPIAALNPPEPYGSFSMTVTDCESPHKIPVDAPAAQSYQDEIPRRTTVDLEREVSLIDTTKWSIQSDSFAVEADLSSTIHQYGNGVYTILLWGEVDAQEVLLSEHSIFVTMLPPPPTPTSTPTPNTSSGLSEEEVKNAREYALTLINIARTASGLNPVILGDNIAAQLHAESALENCFSSHWGIDGLKPYMRYTLRGGQQYNAENVSGLDYCITAGDGYAKNRSVEYEIGDATEGLLQSPGHRRNILNKWHKKVNFGIALDDYNFTFVQHFEGDYVEYSEVPTISNGILSFKANTQNGARIRDEDSLGVQIFYDPPVQPLTRGQVSRTYCLKSGLQIASLRPPLQPNWFYDSDDFTPVHSQPACPDPYEVPADASPPRSADEAHDYWQAAYDASQTEVEITVTLPWITATDWSVTNDSFAISADVSNLVAQHGNGVYTILLWGQINGEDIPISEYSIFIPPYQPTE